MWKFWSILKRGKLYKIQKNSSFSCQETAPYLALEGTHPGSAKDTHSSFQCFLLQLLDLLQGISNTQNVADFKTENKNYQVHIHFGSLPAQILKSQTTILLLFGSQLRQSEAQSVIFLLWIEERLVSARYGRLEDLKYTWSRFFFGALIFYNLPF